MNIEQLHSRSENIVSLNLNDEKSFDQFVLLLEDLYKNYMDRGAEVNNLYNHNTKDPESKRQWEEFNFHVRPEFEKLELKLLKMLTSSEHFPKFEKKYYLFGKKVKNKVELQKEENIPDSLEVDNLGKEYSSVYASFKVPFQGESLNYQEVGLKIQDLSRAEAELLWKAQKKVVADNEPKLSEIYSKQFDLRKKIAARSNLDPISFYFKNLNRNYSPQDCRSLHQTLNLYFSPLLKRLTNWRKKKMNLAEVRPWDTSKNIFSLPSKLFTTYEELMSLGSKLLHAVDGDVGKLLHEMDKAQTLDLMSNDGKAPGGYCGFYSLRGIPYIFMNSVGTYDNLTTLVHEMGHGYHSSLCKKQELFYGFYSSEMAELASMSLELLALEKFSATGLEISKEELLIKELSSILSFFPWMSMVDLFQLEVYQWEKFDSKLAHVLWLKLREEFYGDSGINFQGLNNYDANSWQAQLHFFKYPFYYVEYGIAQLGALQIWLKSQENFSEALAGYKKALSLGASCSNKDVYEAAGIRWVFDDYVIEDMAQSLDGILTSLGV